MIAGFTNDRVAAGEVSINLWRGGHGPPVLLLHGYPQTHVMWRHVAVGLAERFTVVCPDLRGYGDSDKPPGGGDHRAYSKRTMANDQMKVMRLLGFETFAVVGHDRGARVARRLTLDHPRSVSRVALLDIVPTRSIYEILDQERGTTVWRYFFLIQPFDLPERLIGGEPGGYLRWTLNEWSANLDALSEDSIAEYERCFNPATVHATCEDYRAGASIDLVHDREDSGHKIGCPTLVIWSRDGLGRQYDVAGIWGQEVERLDGHELDCGHFIAEERPQQTTQILLDFLAATTP